VCFLTHAHPCPRFVYIQEEENADLNGEDDTDGDDSSSSAAREELAERESKLAAIRKAKASARAVAAAAAKSRKGGSAVDNDILLTGGTIKSWLGDTSSICTPPYTSAHAAASLFNRLEESAAVHTAEFYAGECVVMVVSSPSHIFFFTPPP